MEGVTDFGLAHVNAQPYTNRTATLPALRRTIFTLRHGPLVACNSKSSGKPRTLGTISSAPVIEKSLTMHRSR